MTDLTALAQSLRDNEAFQEALSIARENARDGLCSVNPRNVAAIRHFQVTVEVIDQLRDTFEQFIRSGAARKKPGIA